MAMRFSMGDSLIETRPKKTRQGKGKHSKYSATSRNGAKKRYSCLLYTSPSPRDDELSRMPSSA